MSGDVAGVRQQFGAATEALYRRVLGLAERATGDTQRAVARLALEVACGTYHDYRSGRPLPKGDLIEALRAVPWQPQIEPRRALEMEVLLGWYDDGDDEARRWAQEVAPPSRQRPARAAAAAPQPLAPREARVHAWLRSHVARHRRGATSREVAAGLGMHRLTASEVLRILAKKSAAVDLGDGAGWLPVVGR